VFITGNSFTSFDELCRCVGLASLSRRQCSNIQRAYIVPEVTSMWNRHSEAVLAAVDTPVIHLAIVQHTVLFHLSIAIN